MQDNILRQFNDMAIRWGRSHQSSQTSYVHYHPHSSDERHDVIPILDNILFALALLQSRTSENVCEAKTILDCLLHFQNNAEPYFGNFPVYLHEYPACKDRALSVQLLPPLYWILKGFHQVLGNDLKQRLEITCKALIVHSFITHEQKSLPYPIAAKLAAATWAFGLLLDETPLAQQGENFLNTLKDTFQQEMSTPIYDTKPLGELLVALQMVYPTLSDSPWEPLWKLMEQTWHHPTSSYIGCSFREHQDGFEPKTILYDLFCGYFSGSLSKRALTANPTHLQAALVRPTTDQLQPPNYPTAIAGTYRDDSHWHLEQHREYALHVSEYKGNVSSAAEKGNQVLKIIWGSPERVHSFVNQTRDNNAITFAKTADGIDLFFHLQSEFDKDSKEKSREIAFFLDFQDGATLEVAGVRSNTFLLGDKVELKTAGLTMNMEFSVVEGEGHFFGHFMRGNRFLQTATVGTKRFESYDWELFLRTINRSVRVPCILKASLKIFTTEITEKEREQGEEG